MISGHPIWHHVVMFFYLEVINIAWIGLASILGYIGWAIFDSSSEGVVRVAVGMPLLVIGGSVILFKIYEVFHTIIRPKIVRAACTFCKNADLED